jgi:hypothetical protein
VASRDRYVSLYQPRHDIEADLRAAHEKRSLTFADHPTSQRKPCLEFPPFHQQALMQNSWDARDPNGRIRILLSEQLISKTASPGEVDLGVTNDIVCFSFQHAPKGTSSCYEIYGSLNLTMYRRPGAGRYLVADTQPLIPSQCAGPNHNIIANFSSNLMDSATSVPGRRHPYAVPAISCLKVHVR